MINIYAPWWGASYIPCNGFHPLYKFLCIPQGSVNMLTSDPAYLLTRKNTWPQYYSGHYSGPKSKLRSEYDSFFVPEELQFINTIDAHVHFFHTSPSFYCTKKFVFHCESFLPIFMPFAFQGKGFLSDVDHVRKYYKELFESDECLGIFSHIEDTLVQISNFFSSNTIDKKLHYSSLGFLGENPTNDLSNKYREMWGIQEDSLVFLYNNSSSQSPGQFALRGGVISLIFASNFLKSHPKSKFIFRCSKPDLNELKLYGVDSDFIEQVNGSSIFWVENFLADDEMASLYSIADFNLLVSANLHSNTILKSMYYSCLPIVTDTLGTSQFVTDMKNGIVLHGVKDAIWRLNNKDKFWFDDHNLFKDAKLFSMLSDQLAVKIKLFIESRNLLNSMQKNAREYCLSNHNAERSSKNLFKKIQELIAGDSHYSTSPYLCNLDEKYFTGQTTPKVVNNLGEYKLLKFQNVFYLETPEKKYSYPSSVSIFGGPNCLAHFVKYSDAVNGLSPYLLNLPSKNITPINSLVSGQIQAFGAKIRVYIKNKYPSLFSRLKLLFGRR